MNSWIPKTNLGREVKDNQYSSIQEVLTNNRITEPQIVDHFNQNLKMELVSMARISHTVSSGKVYQYQAVVLLGKPGVIGCGVGKDIVRAKAIKKAQSNAKKRLTYLGKLQKNDFFTPERISLCKKGATTITVHPLPGHSITASKFGRIYCNLVNLKGVKITTGNKKRNVKGKVGSKLNYYTALHEAITEQL